MAAILIVKTLIGKLRLIQKYKTCTHFSPNLVGFKHLLPYTLLSSSCYLSSNFTYSYLCSKKSKKIQFDFGKLHLEVSASQSLLSVCLWTSTYVHTYKFVSKDWPVIFKFPYWFELVCMWMSMLDLMIYFWYFFRACFSHLFLQPKFAGIAIDYRIANRLIAIFVPTD